MLMLRLNIPWVLVAFLNILTKMHASELLSLHSLGPFLQ